MVTCKLYNLLSLFNLRYFAYATCDGDPYPQNDLVPHQCISDR